MQVCRPLRNPSSPRQPPQALPLPKQQQRPAQIYPLLISLLEYPPTAQHPPILPVTVQLSSGKTIRMALSANLKFTWDPARFTADSNDTVSIKYVNDSGDGDFPRWDQTVPNEKGYVEVSMDAEWLNGQTRNNLSIWIDNLEPDGSRKQVSGPVVALISRPTPSVSPSNTPTPAPPAPHKSSNKLGMEVGIPLGLAFLLALFVGLFLGMRRSGRGRGYIANRARNFRGHGTAQLTGDEFRTARRRGESFKDEPVQDVELQPRRGHAREDSMGTFMDSPTSGGLGDVRRQETNAFRAELARQRAGDHLPKR
ncbi:MAG: hypothetical protein Q9191_006825 [Dirinaria sp. TL-2023a]